MSAAFGQLRALIVKEFKEAFRDKRAMMVAFSMSLLAPVMIMVLSKTMIKELVETPPVYAEIVGAEYAPKLVKEFTDENILPLSESKEDDLRIWQERGIKITIPETYGQDMVEGNIIDVVLNADYSDKPSLAPIRRIKDVITDHARTIGYKRLVMRGVDVRILQPLNLVEQDRAQPSSNAMMISTMLGLYLLMGAFMSGLSIAIDSSAGERERNVLEMLLCQPVSTTKIVLAKLSCAASISILSIVLMLVVTSITVGFVDLSKIGATFSIDAGMFIALLALLIPVCILAAALQLFFSFQAKSFKEAQSTVTMLIMLPAFIPFILMFIDDRPLWLDWLPVAGQSIIIEDMFKGLAINWTAFAFTSVTTIALAAVLVMTLAQKLKSEKVVMALS
ncbi:ABC transporter permease [Thalassotalea euphylliae]|uniref:ABC transporter permease n=1 Tax=Thalassotalea euphylliae TaxID=1655234 RepID=A0A3E0TN59_9GAMM|nr:ABC transporter permease [Thalassotalea euphylliae]REL25938.1 ABC transporter permease [Thalassotalea euphylliae]